MYIKSIYLKNYKNYKEEKINFEKDINIIYGNNAQGKTNLIESIYLLSYGKAFRSNINESIVNFQDSDTFVEAEFLKNNRDQKISFYFNKKTNKKFLKINEVAQNKLSNLYGKINIVVYKPEDIDIVKKGPSIRRKYIDMLISSVKPMYISIISNYNLLLKQRNYFLKNFKEKYFSRDSKIDRNYLDVLNTKFADYSNKIYEYRKEFIEKINKIANEFHLSIVEQKNENLSFEYKSDSFSKDNILKKLKNNEKNDFIKGYTSVGIHRDDMVIKINGMDLALFGSQGQQKSSILSLKLSEIKIIESEMNEKPIMLLDDFMSELDENRQKLFIEKIKDYQIIITSTKKITIDKRNNKLIEIKNGKIFNDKK